MECTARDTWLTICLWVFLGLTGGAVRACEQPNRISYRRMLSSLLTSAFAGGIGGSLFSAFIHDPVVLGGLSAITGYFGQLSLIMFIKWAQKKFGISND